MKIRRFVHNRALLLLETILLMHFGHDQNSYLSEMTVKANSERILLLDIGDVIPPPYI